MHTITHESYSDKLIIAESAKTLVLGWPVGVMFNLLQGMSPL